VCCDRAPHPVQSRFDETLTLISANRVSANREDTRHPTVSAEPRPRSILAHFSLKILTSGGNSLCYVPENQLNNFRSSKGKSGPEFSTTTWMSQVLQGYHES